MCGAGAAAAAFVVWDVQSSYASALLWTTVLLRLVQSRRLPALMISRSRAGMRFPLVSAARGVRGFGLPPTVVSTQQSWQDCIIASLLVFAVHQSTARFKCAWPCATWVHCGARMQPPLFPLCRCSFAAGVCSCGWRSSHTALGTAAGKCHVRCMHSSYARQSAAILLGPVTGDAIVFRRCWGMVQQ